MFKQAYKITESSLRKSQQSHSHNPTQDAIYLRDIHAFIFIRRRLAMCARKLGKLKEAIKIMREVCLLISSLSLCSKLSTAMESSVFLVLLVSV